MKNPFRFSMKSVFATVAIVSLICYCRMDIEKRTDAYLKSRGHDNSIVNRSLLSNQVVTNLPGEEIIRKISLWGSETTFNTVKLPPPFHSKTLEQAAQATYQPDR